jgi:hypothetical protein
MSYLHAEPAVQRGQRALSALMFGLEENGLRATLNIQRTAPATDGGTSATVKISLPLDALRFDETDTGQKARVRVVVALRSTGGLKPRSAAVVREKEFTIALPPGGATAGLHDVFVDVPIDGASHDFAVGVEDLAPGVASSYLRRRLGGEASGVAVGDGLSR